MRKYTQLMLVLVAVTCFIFMAFYERRYSKVKVLLDILNMYRTGGNNVSEVSSKPSAINRNENSILKPHWLEVVSKVHIYSAFSVNRSNFIHGPHIHILTMIHGEIPGEINCILYNEDETTPVPVTAYTVILLETLQNGRNSFLLAMCPLQNEDKNPYAVSLVTSNVSTEKHLFGSTQVTKSKRGVRRKFVACVEPLSVGFNDVFSLIEFLVYYDTIGVDHFILYQRGVAYSVEKVLLEAQKNLSIEVLPWNVPFGSDDLSDVAFFTDCIYRSGFAFNDTHVLKLNVRQFLFLGKTESLSAVLDSKNDQNSLERMSVYSFQTRVFCTEFEDDIVAKTLAFPFVTQRKLWRIDDGRTQQVSLIFHIVLSWLTEIVSTLKLAIDQHGIPPRKMSPEKAVLYTYPICDSVLPEKIQKNRVEDRTMFQYKKLFFKSHLYKFIAGSVSKKLNSSYR